MKTFKIKDNPKISTSDMMVKFKKRFKVSSYGDDLDLTFPPPKEETEREFAFKQDPDRTNVSYNDLKKEGVEFMTFREYLIAFEYYFDETGEHLDEKGFTLFSDTLSDGLVAGGYWYADSAQARFCWYDPDYCNPGIGARLAISPLKTSPSLSLESAIKRVKKEGYKIYKEI